MTKEKEKRDREKKEKARRKRYKRGKEKNRTSKDKNFVFRKAACMSVHAPILATPIVIEG